MSNLGPLVESLVANKVDVTVSHQILLQFLNGVETNLSEFSSYSKDTHFPTFLQFIFDLLVRSTFPTPSESPIPDIHVKSLNLLSTMAINHPDLLSIIASLAPLDQLAVSFFQKNISEDRLIDPQPSHFFPMFQFLAAVSMSSSISITSTPSMHILFSALISAIGSAQLAPWAIASIAGFARNCTAANSFLRALPNFSMLRREIAALLSSNNHSIVIASLSALSALFPRSSIDVDTAMKVSLAAVVNPPQLSVATTLAAAVVLQYSDEIALSTPDIESILKAAMKTRGMRAFVIYKLLIEMDQAHRVIPDLLINPSFYNNFLSSLLSCEDGFVTVAGSHLLTIVFDSNPPAVENDILEPFSKALRFVISDKFEDLDRTEAMLIIMRLLVRVRESMTQIIRLLQENEENVFIGFQRHIESNHAFVAVNFFLFIHSASHFFKHWFTKLRELVIDSQFSALLVHVLSTAQNRRVINDAIIVTHLIMNGINSKMPNLDAPLTDTISSGFFIVNHQLKQEKLQLETRLQQIDSINYLQMQEMEVSRDLIDRESIALREENEKLKQQCSSDQSQIQSLTKENESLQKRMKSKKIKLNAAIEELRNTESQNHIYNSQLSTIEQEKNASSEYNQKLKEKVRALKQLQDDYNKNLQRNAQLETQAKNDKLKIKELTEERDKLIDTINLERAKRKEIDELLTAAQDRINEQSTQLDNEKLSHLETGKQVQRFEGLLKKKSEREKELSDMIDALKDENDKMKNENLQLKQQNDDYRATTTSQKLLIAELKKDRKDLIAMTQLIHRLTDGKFENMESIVGMINKESI